jgi:hypothetical protein
MQNQDIGLCLFNAGTPGEDDAFHVSHPNGTIGSCRSERALTSDDGSDRRWCNKMSFVPGKPGVVTDRERAWQRE